MKSAISRRGRKLDAEARRKSNRMLAVAVICLFLFILVVVAGPLLRNIRESADVDGQPLQRADAVVDGITYLPATKWDPAPMPIFHIKVKDQRVDYRSLLNLQPGQHITVAYREGKGGNIHIEAVEQ